MFTTPTPTTQGGKGEGGMNEQAGTATRYDVVQGDSTNGYKVLEFGSRLSLIAHLARQGIAYTGDNANHRQRAELQGQPVFNSIVGPMFDGKRGDSVQVIRYEVAR